MASNNILKTRLVNKHDIEANWLKATGFIPLDGEIIVYEADETCAYPRFKVGDGATNVNDLPFAESPTQADWNQNDPNAPDYVKNRTHWEEGNSLGELICESNSWRYNQQDNGNITHIAYLSPHFEPKDLENIAFEWEGKVYYSKTKSVPEINDAVYFGNLTLSDNSLENLSTEDCPVCGILIAAIPEQHEDVCVWVIDSVKRENPSFRLWHANLEQVHKLDPKFMHETVVMAERPEIGGEVIILPETEIAVASDENPIMTAPNAKPEVGSVCTVTYNGTAYDCPVVAFADNGMAGVVFGNSDAIGLPGGNATAPFIVLLLDTPMDVDGSLAYGMLALIGEITEGTIVTLSIVQAKEVVPQQLVMDKDGNIKWEDRTHWVEGEIVEILPETIIAEASDEALEALFATPFTQSIVAGKTYLVSYCGTTYVCVGTSYTGNGITAVCLGNLGAFGASGGNPDAPFILFEIPDEMTETFSGVAWMLEPITEDGYPLPLTIGIKCNDEIVHKIDNKFLDIAPSNWNALPGTPGHIENRTHYCDHVVMTYDPTKLAGVDTLTVGFGSGNPITFYKIGDYALDAAALKASSYTITTLSTGEQSTTAVTMAQDNNGVSTGMTPAFVIYSIHDLAAASAQGVNAPSTGTYMVVISEEACTVTVDSGEIIKKIDEKYLPTLEEMGSNLIRGSAEGSTRSINSKAESDVYVIGKYATSIGLETEAHGEGSLAEGHRSKAFGNGSHAEGFDTSARGGESHAEGYKAIAFGSGSHAEGWSTAAIGLGSHAEGSGDVYEIKLTGDANSRIYTYTNFSWPHNTVMYGYVIQYGDTFATIDKYTNTTLSLSKTLSSEALSDANAFIYTGVAFGGRSHSEGYECAAADNNSHAEGSCTKAIGYCSHSQGVQSIAAGSSSHAQGWYTMASGDYAVADGFYTRALGTISHAAGWDTESFGRSQFVIGEHNKISEKARYSDETKTTSLPARTAPYTIWKLPGAHVNIVSQTSLEVNGEYQFDGDILPVDDYTTLVVGDYIALSKNTKTCYYELLTPITEEDQTYKAEVIEHTIVDNYSERGEYVFVVGNGDPRYANNPTSNAHAVDWDGNAYYAGDVYVQGDGKTFEFDGKKKLATESYVDSKIPTPEDALALMIEMGFVDPVADETGAMYTDDNGKIFTY